MCIDRVSSIRYNKVRPKKHRMSMSVYYHFSDTCVWDVVTSVRAQCQYIGDVCVDHNMSAVFLSKSIISHCVFLRYVACLNCRSQLYFDRDMRHLRSDWQGRCVYILLQQQIQQCSAMCREQRKLLVIADTVSNPIPCVC